MSDDTNTRKGKRTPVTLKIKFKSATLDQFIERYSVDVSHGGIFIRTKDPLAVGTELKFEFQLQDASPLIAGEGVVVWTRDPEGARPGVAPGMGVRFDKLSPDSSDVLGRILKEKARTESQAEEFDSGSEEATRVGDVQSLAAADTPGGMGAASPSQSFEGTSHDKTPLPNPMPFHAADDFSEDAFDQPTRVAALDTSLLAQAAGQDPGDLPPDEEWSAEAAATDGGNQSVIPATGTAEPRAGTQQGVGDEAPPPPDGSAAAEPSGQTADQPPTDELPSGADPVPDETASEPAAAPTPVAAAAPVAAATPAAAAPATPAPAAAAPATPAPAAKPPVARPLPIDDEETLVPAKKSRGGLIAAILVLGVAAAGAYFFLSRTANVVPAPVVVDEPDAASDVVAAVEPPPVEVISDAAVDEPVADATPAMVQLSVTTTPPGARVSVNGALKEGMTPMTLELPPGEDVVVGVARTCYQAASREVTVTDELAPLEVELEPLPRVLVVTSDPPKARVDVNGKRRGQTPARIRLNASESAGELAISASRRGYEDAQTTVAPGAECTEDGGVAVITAELTLDKKERPRPTVVERPEPPRPEPVRPTPRPRPEPEPEPAPAADPEPDRVIPPALRPVTPVTPKPDAAPAPGPQPRPEPRTPEPTPTPTPPADEHTPDWASE